MTGKLRQRAVAGIGWTAVARVLQLVLQLGTGIVLARLLRPEDFGLVGMVTVFTGFAILFQDLGLGAALIQRDDIEDRHMSSVFWINLTIASVMTALVIAGAPLLARFYGEQRLTSVTMLIAPSFVFASLGVVQAALLGRELKFSRLAFCEIGSVTAASVVAIVLAILDLGYEALAWQLLAVTGSRSALLWFVSPWRPRFRFDLAGLRDLIGFGGNLTLFNLLNYWVRKGDDLLIGRFVGSAALGLYTRAYTFLLLPITSVATVIGTVLFPTLSVIKHDHARVRRIYLRTIAAIALVCFPTMAGLAVVADHFVIGVLGESWRGAVPILRILAPVGLLQSVITTTGLIYQAQGRTDQMLRWGLISGATTIAAFAIGIRWGAVGVAAAYAIRSTLIAPVAMWFAGRLIGLSLGEVGRALAGVASSSIGMAVVVAAPAFLLPGSIPHLGRFAICVAAGIASYSVLARLLRLPIIDEVRAAFTREPPPEADPQQSSHS